MIAPQARERGLALRNDVPADLPPLISDRAKCRHILQNLIGNTVKFTEAGQVTVAAGRVGSDGANRQWPTPASASPPTKCPTSSTNFARPMTARAQVRRQRAGAGDRPEVRDAAGRRHRGGDTPGRGSTFTVTLPLTWDAGARARSGVSGIEASAGLGSRRDRLKPRCQIPKQNDPPRRAPGRSAASCWWKTASRPSSRFATVWPGRATRSAWRGTGHAALAQIAQAPPDALILDLMMPEVDGFAVLRAVAERRPPRSSRC